MTMHSWVRQLSTRSTQRPVRKAPPRARLRLKILEDRCVPSTFTVNSTGDTGAGSGLTGDLRYCITQANLGGTNSIQFDPTVFNTAQTITLALGQLELSDTTGTETLTGPAGGVTISGNNASRVFQVDANVTASISGLTITGGSAGYGGGGLLNSGTVTLTNCTVSGNSAGYGGGLGNTGTATLTSCTVSGNSAFFGGGLSNFGTVTLASCTVSGNSGVDGGGVYNLFGAVTLTNCTVSGNSAGSNGGGLDNSFFGTARLTNCTVSGDSAFNGGGLYCGFSASTITLANTIIAANTGHDVAAAGGGAFISQGNNLVGATNGISGWVSSDLTGTNLQPLNPVLAPLGSYGGPTATMALLPGSPALEAGNDALIPAEATTDQRGLPRIVNGTVDIGAFESQGFNIAAVPGSTPQTSDIGTPFQLLAVTVTANNLVEPVDGGVVTFAANPAANGASAMLSASSAVIANGQAGVSAEPNNVDGGYSVVASFPGFSASFQLTNAGPVYTSLLVNTTSGSLFPGMGLMSLPEAIAFNNASPSNLSITFSSAVFNTAKTITLTGSQLELRNTNGTATITGPKAGVTVSGGGLSRVFQVDAGVSASFSGLTLSGGTTNGNGGGFLNEGTTALTNCAITGNSANTGGGLDNAGIATLTDCTVNGNTTSFFGSGGGGMFNTGTATLSNCTVSGNLASNGGGVFNSGTTTLANSTVNGNFALSGGGLFNSGTTALTNCTISGNSANGNSANGGGAFNSGTATLTSCTISNNFVSGYGAGGGVFNSGTATVTACTVSGNTTGFSGSGGGVSNSGAATLINCTISANSAPGYSHGGGLNNAGTIILANCTVSGDSARVGGGLDNNYHGTVTLTNCTVSGNSAVRGGGLDNNVFGGTITLANTIIAANTGHDVAAAGGGAFISQGNNLVGATNGISGWVSSDLTGTNLQPLNPVLAPLGSYGGPTATMALLPGSPAFGAGTPTGAPTTDQRGEPRRPGGAVDIGAFESQGFTLTLVAGTSPQTSNIGTPFANPLAVTVTANDPVEPVNGGIVAFMANHASNGATAILSASSAAIASGQAAVIAEPDNVDGSYQVLASISGLAPVAFNLTNTGPAYTSLVVNTASGSLFPGKGLLSLPEAIAFDNLSAAGMKITFSSTVFNTAQTITLTGSQLDLSNTKGTETIVGPAPGVTVSGGGLSRVFQVDTNVTASLSGLTITGGNAGYGNGGGLANFGTLTMTNCTVRASSAYSAGGGLYNDGALTMTKCTVSDNSSYSFFGTGGGVYSNGLLMMTGCTVSGNFAYGSGGGLGSNGTATLLNCTISGNSTNTSGGGLANTGNLTLTGCTLSGNSAYDGGGLYSLGTATLTNCSVGGNSAYLLGGGLFSGGMATLNSCTVSGNSAGINGGGITNFATLAVGNCTIANNTASSSGGGLFGGTYSTMQLTNTTIKGNTSQGAGGGISLYSGGTATLSGCTVSGNSASFDGGGVYNGGTAALTNCTVSGNSASASSGGGLYNSAFAALTMTSCTVSGNSAVAGGGIANQGTLNITGSNISNNKATSKGAGISATAGSASIAGSSLTGNQVNSAGAALGGAIDCENSTLSLSNCILTGNLAKGTVLAEGGGIGCAYSTLSLTNCTVSNNQATGQTALGGGIYALNSVGSVQNTKVQNNQAKGSVLGEGGGIYSYDPLYGTLLSLFMDTVSGNSATTSYKDIFNGV